jgi:hypothetical protein
VPSAPASQQPTLSTFVAAGSEGARYSSTNPRQQSITESLVSDVIVGCNLPISIIDNLHFRRFLSILDKKYAPPHADKRSHFRTFQDFLSRLSHLLKITLTSPQTLP